MAYDDFGDYMKEKHRKLQEQSAHIAQTQKQSNIFAGIIVYFDGHVGDMTMTDLKELFLLHGGLVHDKLTPQVTHIIATTMTDTKMKQHRRPVVTPSWILESIEAQKLLSYLNYRLYSLLAPSQSTLFTTGSTTTTTKSRSHMFLSSSSSSSVPNTSKATSSETQHSAKATASRDNDGFLRPLPKTPTKVVNNLSDSLVKTPTKASTNADIEDDDSEESDEGDDSWFGPKPDVDMNSDWVKANVCTAPGFLDRYFATSRLHFLSTWKQDLIDFVIAEKANMEVLPPDSPFYPRPAKPTAKQPKLRTIAHIDMDCFFASVHIRDHPELANKPVAVAHSSGLGGKSTSELASCNYVARSHGIANGSSVGKARQLCPDLQVVPYEFDKYDEVSRKLYRTLLAVADEVQAVSCDEAYIDVSSRITGRGQGQELALANLIRAEIRKETGCPASVGISESLVAARMATKKAKPDGAFWVGGIETPRFMESVKVDDLPGVGWGTKRKLADIKVTTCKELSSLGLGAIQNQVGDKTGQTLFNFAKGIDTRVLVNKPRQSIGAEINWGVRFQNDEQVETFFDQLAEEIHKRMTRCRVKGRHIHVTLKKRLYEGEPPKILGCGHCENLSKSKDLSFNIFTKAQIFREGWELIKSIRSSSQVAADEIRGVGIHITKLDNDQRREDGQQRLQFLAKPYGSRTTSLASSSSKPVLDKVDNVGAGKNEVGAPLPTFEEIDMESLSELPPEIRQEYFEYYEGQKRSREVAFALELEQQHEQQEQHASKRARTISPKKELTMSQLIPQDLSAIPPEVYNQLPLDIRRELDTQKKNAEKLRNKATVTATTTVTSKKSGGLIKKVMNKKIQKRQPDIKQSFRRQNGIVDEPLHIIPKAPPRQIPIIEPPVIKLPIPFMGHTSIPDIRDTLGEWISSTADEAPDEDDVSSVVEYLVEKVHARECADVLVLMRYLSRTAADCHDGWKQAVERMWLECNEAAVSIYGCPLKRD
ncbi:DNA-directed DNA polymerase [Synchytrium microbalum]|uniref:DNA repair protein REV1 n=1 Tax=Synchytrium microbalum TaxID=1806994 RepID=A0A507BYT0_9FUNG|nr:DNA-directed DNA polymerase [Synchytrium microbalum]TPX32278.1 DNA-directed DNA polymerase [Synchytrium microbalum]